MSPAERGEWPDLAETLGDAFRLDRSSTVESAEGEVFIRIFNPPVRLIIIGAVHAAQFLLPIARMIGHDVTIIDPRTAFATPERFPDAHLVAEWPEDGLPLIGIDSRTAMIALTHDAKIDDGALRMGLASGAFYVGALGSSRTHAKRLERLKQMGCSDAGSRPHSCPDRPRYRRAGPGGNCAFHHGGIDGGAARQAGRLIVTSRIDGGASFQQGQVSERCLEHFPAKWAPVCVAKMRPSKEIAAFRCNRNAA